MFHTRMIRGSVVVQALYTLEVAGSRLDDVIEFVSVYLILLAAFSP
jgi:hypothetical protein